MVKEYNDILLNVKSENSALELDKQEDLAKKTFNKLFGITVNEAIELDNKGEWSNWLKSNSKKDLESSDSQFKSFFCPTNFELKEEPDGYFVSGFISSDRVDEYGDVVDQYTLLNKINDQTNIYASLLSYQHGWIKGDKSDSKALGVLQYPAEMKLNPATGREQVYATYKLMKTHPNFENAIYELKNKAIKGFSIEFKEAKRKLIKIGNIVAKKLEDYVFGGVGLVSRPANHDAMLTGFVAKEFIYNDDGEDSMEIKEDKKVVEESTDKKVEETNVEADTSKNDEELSKIKAEIEASKKEVEKLKLEQEKQKVFQELAALKAKKTVMVDTTEETVESQKPAAKPVEANPLDDVNKILENKHLSVYDKIKQTMEIEEKYNK